MAYALIYILSLLPLRVLYGLADVIALLMYGVVRYRRRVVRSNLVNSFPEYSFREIRRAERRFYRFLADYFVETVKLASMSERQMRRRMRFEGIEAVNADLDSGRHVSLFLGHYCNWEWISSLPLHLSRRSHPCQIYHRLRNQVSDRVFLRLRSRFAATCVPMDEALNVLAADYRAGTPNITGYIADQSPKYNSLHHFVRFLNQETGVLTGVERLSRMVHASAYYCEVSRPRRGYYICRFVKMADDAAAMERFALTDKYWQMLEATIRRRPELWLWSHRRWKHTMEGLRRRFPDDWQRRLNRL